MIPQVLFTTHTPVPAGIDRFERELIEPHLQPWADAWGDKVESLLALGADPEDGLAVFNMAAVVPAPRGQGERRVAAPRRGQPRAVREGARRRR